MVPSTTPSAEQPLENLPVCANRYPPQHLKRSDYSFLEFQEATLKKIKKSIVSRIVRQDSDLSKEDVIPLREKCIQTSQETETLVKDCRALEKSRARLEKEFEERKTSLINAEFSLSKIALIYNSALEKLRVLHSSTLTSLEKGYLSQLKLENVRLSRSSIDSNAVKKESADVPLPTNEEEIFLSGERCEQLTAAEEKLEKLLETDGKVFKEAAAGKLERQYQKMEFYLTQLKRRKPFLESQCSINREKIEAINAQCQRIRQPIEFFSELEASIKQLGRLLELSAEKVLAGEEIENSFLEELNPAVKKAELLLILGETKYSRIGAGEEKLQGVSQGAAVSRVPSAVYGENVELKARIQELEKKNQALMALVEGESQPGNETAEAPSPSTGVKRQLPPLPAGPNKK